MTLSSTLDDCAITGTIVGFITMLVTTVFWIIIIIVVCIVLKRRRQGYKMNLRNRGNGGNGRQPTDHDRYVDLSPRETTSLTSTRGPNSASNDSVCDSQRSPTSQTSTQEPAPPKVDGAQEDPTTTAESEDAFSGSTEGKDSTFSKEIGGSAEWNSGASTEADDNDNTNQGEESHPRTRSTRSLSITSPRKESGHPEEKKRLISSFP